MMERILLFNAPGLESPNVVRDLLYGCWCQGKRIAGATFPPHSLLSIYTKLKSKFQVYLYDYLVYTYSETAFQSIIQKMSWIILPSAEETWEEDKVWLNRIKQINPKIKTVIFGAISTFRTEIIKNPDLDFGIVGEPEEAIFNLLERSQFSIQNQESLSDLFNIVYYDENEDKIHTTPQKFVDLDSLPIVDREPILNQFYFNPLTETQRWTTMLSSRGCPNKCIFCTSPNFYGKKYRYNSVKYMLKEIEYLKNLGFQEIFFRDETFTSNQTRVREFCKQIIDKNIKIKWICNARVNTVNKSLLSRMKQAGCHTIKFGVESGSQRILDYFEKGIRREQIIEVFKWCHEIGIKTHAHMILNAPIEKNSDFQKSMELLKIIQPSTVTFNQFRILSGSPIAKKNEQKQSCFFPNNNQLIRAYRKFYLRPRYIIQKLIEIRNLASFSQLAKSAMNIFTFMF